MNREDFKNKDRIRLKTNEGVEILGKVDDGWDDLKRDVVRNETTEMVPVHLDGTHYISYHVPWALTKVEPEPSESERLPNGTVVREVDVTIPSVAEKNDGVWYMTGDEQYFRRLSWIDSGDYEILTASDSGSVVPPEPKTPRTFNAGDPEPGPEVTHVRDKDGSIWIHGDFGWGVTPNGSGKFGDCPWSHVTQYGPITEVSK